MWKVRPDKVTGLEKALPATATKHSATKDEEQFPAQIYNLPCCSNSWTLPYAPKENGPPHFWLKGKKVRQWKKSIKKEPGAEHKKMRSESKLSEHKG